MSRTYRRANLRSFMHRLSKHSLIVALVVVVVVSLGDGFPAADGATAADWRYIDFVFTGSGSGTMTFAPRVVGKSQRFNLTWKAVWRLKPNQGYAKNVSYTVTGRSSFIGTDAADDCSGKIGPAPNNPPQILPTGTSGRYTLLGASVPMFGSHAVVPKCAGKVGYPINSGPLTPTPSTAADRDEVKHRIAVAEFPLDFASPGSITLTYPRKAGGAWRRKDGTGASQTIGWKGKLVVTVVR